MSGAGAPLLEVSGLVTGYRQEEILHGVGLRAVRGETVGVIGPNGAGKSTLLKALAGVLTLRSGSVRLAGEDVGRLRAPHRVRRGMVLVPEGRQIFARLTVAENLWLGGFGAPATRDQATALVHEMFPRLRERSAQLAGTLSGGEQQMLAIARGLMAGPTMLMIDEPSLGLAPVLVESLVTYLRDISGRLGVTMLIAEQGLSLASYICDRMYVLAEGRMVAEASPDLSESDLLALYLGATPSPNDGP